MSRGRNLQCEFVETNVRPSTYNIKDNCKHDCTTRCITFCLKGEMTYQQVEDEQYRLAKIHNSVRNRTGVYDLILKKRGYRWIQLENVKTTANIASYLRDFTTPMPILSRSHIAVIENGKLIDTWDSRGTRIFGIMCKLDEAVDVINRLRKFGITSKIVDIPRYKINHHRRYYW